MIACLLYIAVTVVFILAGVVMTPAFAGIWMIIGLSFALMFVFKEFR